MAFGGWLGQQISDAGSSIDDFVNENIPGGWTTAALIAGGYYYYPQISAWMTAEGALVPATEAATADAAATGATTSAVTGGAAGAASGVPITTAATNAATSAGVLGTTLTANQIASLAKAGISLAGIAGAANAVNTDTGGGLLTQQQDRSGFSSGSANYSPEYYAAIQSKYNQYMPQAKGADITTDLKNWYETKYTPQANVATAPTLTTTGTGYSTPTTLTNLGIKPQTVAPSYTALSPSTSNATDVASEYAKYIAAAGGNTQANRDAAIQYLQQKGFSGPQIDAGYNAYLSTLPASTGNTAQSMAANSTPSQIAQAYAAFVKQEGGDTQANQARAIKYLQQIGVPYATIEAAYPIYKSSIAPQAGSTGMLTGSAIPQQQQQQQTTTSTSTSTAAAAAPSAPSYTSLTGSSSPQAIAQAYSQFVAGAGGDSQANQEAAIKYLNNLGVSNDTIGQAYGLFKG